MTLWILAGLAGLYAVYGAAMVRVHPRFIYPFQQDPFAGSGYEVIDLPVAGAEALPVQVARGAPGAPVIVYFMGNVGALDLFRPMLDHHKAQGRTVIALQFRGAGGVPGRSSEATLKRDALALFDAVSRWVPDGGPVFVQGYSMGTGLALHVAARRAVDGVILSAPFHRMCELMARASWLPACMLPVQRWDSAADADRVSGPVLVQHGTADRLIPIRQGERLSERLSAAGAAPRFMALPGAGHNDLIDHPDYLPAVDAFIAAVPGG